MNVQENFLIPAELDIQSLPALALYVDGKFEKFIGGIGKKDEVLKQLADYVWKTILGLYSKSSSGGKREEPEPS